MTQIVVNGRSFDVDMIVFDKDGTLIDLNLWGQQIEKWGKLLKNRFALGDAEIHIIYEEIGYDAQNQLMLPDQPVSVASLDQLSTIVSFLLYRRGIIWSRAEKIVQETAMLSVAALPDRSMLRFIGDVPGTLKRLRKSGIQIGIATSDDRLPTEKALELLKIDSLIDIIVCADDPIPMKPAPDGLLHISKEMGIPAGRMMMVGDSSGDMQCGRKAGVVGCIRIGQEDNGLSIDSDVTIQSIDEIEIR